MKHVLRLVRGLFAALTRNESFPAYPTSPIAQMHKHQMRDAKGRFMPRIAPVYPESFDMDVID